MRHRPAARGGAVGSALLLAPVLALTGALVEALMGAPPAGAEPGPPGLPELVEALERPRLVAGGTGAGGAHPVAPAVDVPGTLRLAPGGTVYPVVAGGLRVGSFFVGGSFEMPLGDGPGRATFELNVRRASRHKVVDGTLAGDLDATLVLDSAPGATAPASASIGTEEPVPEDVTRAFERLLERYAEDRLVDAPSRIAQALLDPDGGRVALVRMQAAREDLLYRYDALSLDEEALCLMERYPNDSALRGERFPVPLVSRPLDAQWLDRDPPRWALRHVDLELVNPEDAALELTVTERIEVRERLETLDFSLWSEIFHLRKRYDYTLASVDLLTDAEGDDGVAVSFSHRNGDLVVALPEPAGPGDEIVLRFRLSGDILQRPGGHSYWWLPIGSWLPLPPRFDQRSFTVHGEVRAADPFIPFGMGTTLRRWQEPGFACLEFELSEPVQFAVVMAGRYHSWTAERDDRSITLSSYAFQEDEPMQRIADNLFALVDWYEERLGPFPYPELNILEINAYGFGIGPPGVLYLTREGFDPGPSGRSFRREINQRLAHEVAHMWWGHVAQMRSPDDQWLSESTAEYFSALAVDALVGRDGFRDAYRDWQEEAGNSKAVPSIYMANRLVGERAAFDRRNLLYGRGPLLLDALREEIGDESFFTTMRRFIDANRHGHVDTAGFIALASEVAGRDLAGWFERELFGS